MFKIFFGYLMYYVVGKNFLQLLSSGYTHKNITMDVFFEFFFSIWNSFAIKPDEKSFNSVVLSRW